MEASHSSYTLGQYAPVLVTPEPGTRPLGTVPVPQCLLKLLKVASSYLFILPCHQSHNKDSYHIFFLSILPPG
jgi:hypothetical protein